MTQIVLQPSADATARAHYADTIDGQGTVAKSPRLVSPVEREYMNSTVVAQIVVSPNQEPYFAWHYQQQFKS